MPTSAGTSPSDCWIPIKPSPTLSANPSTVSLRIAPFPGYSRSTASRTSRHRRPEPRRLGDGRGPAVNRQAGGRHLSFYEYALLIPVQPAVVEAHVAGEFVAHAPFSS